VNKYLHSDSGVKTTANAPNRYANRLSCVECYAGTLSQTHAKAGQHHSEESELKDNIVHDTALFASRVY